MQKMKCSEDQEFLWDPSLWDETWDRTNLNGLMLMVKDPTTIFAYWEVDATRRALISEHFKSAWSNLPLYLQLYDVSDRIFNGENAHSVRRIQVHPDSDNFYIHDVESQRYYILDLGTLTLSGTFFSILRSNALQMPPQQTFQECKPYLRFDSIHDQLHPKNQLLQSLTQTDVRHIQIHIQLEPQRQQHVQPLANLTVNTDHYSVNKRCDNVALTENWQAYFNGYSLCERRGGEAY